MDAFSLLKYWRGGGGVFSKDNNADTSTRATTDSSSTTTTIVTAVSPSSSTSDSDEENGDDGPFFDLEFTLPDDSDNENEVPGKEQESEPTPTAAAAIDEEFANEKSQKVVEEEEELLVAADVISVSENEINEGSEEIKFMLSSSSSADSADPNVTLSPSDDLFFKGRLVPIETTSIASESIPKFPVSAILKSATKFRVKMLKFNKSKSNVLEKPAKSAATNEKNQEGQDGKQQQSKFFTVKLKVEEVPLVSLFTRDNSSRGNVNKANKRSSNDVTETKSDLNSSSNSAPDDKKFSKDVMQKYLKKVKPLYIRVSKRYGEKLRFSGQLSFSKSGGGGDGPSSSSTVEAKSSPPAKSASPKGAGEGEELSEMVAGSNVKSQKQGNLQAGLRVVCKHLGKSRSASSAVVAAAPSSGPAASRRRDDSLLEQQDGIQSAIMHCKRSFNASRELDASILPHLVSDSSSHEKSANLSAEESLSSVEAKES